MASKDLLKIECTTLKDLRDWLARNYHSNESVWLIYYKPSTNLGDITYSSLVDELLCYGWVDSLPRKIDEKRTSIRISPRNPKSNWSKINKDKVERLTKDGRMKKPGLEIVSLAKQTGTWDALNDVENLVVPAELKSALKKQGLSDVWNKTSESKKRGWLEQLFNAKSIETKLKRVNEIITNLS